MCACMAAPRRRNPRMQLAVKPSLPELGVSFFFHSLRDPLIGWIVAFFWLCFIKCCFSSTADVFPRLGDHGGTDSGAGTADVLAAASLTGQTQHLLWHRLQGRLQQVDFLSHGQDLRGLFFVVPRARDTSTVQVSRVYTQLPDYVGRWIMLANENIKQSKKKPLRRTFLSTTLVCQSPLPPTGSINQKPNGTRCARKTCLRWISREARVNSMRKCLWLWPIPRGD